MVVVVVVVVVIIIVIIIEYILNILLLAIGKVADGSSAAAHDVGGPAVHRRAGRAQCH